MWFAPALHPPAPRQDAYAIPILRISYDNERGRSLNSNATGAVVAAPARQHAGIRKTARQRRGHSIDRIDKFIYTRRRWSATTMLNDLRRGAAFLLYQLVLAVGILAMPVALGARRLGLTLPIRRLVELAERTYRNGSR